MHVPDSSIDGTPKVSNIATQRGKSNLTFTAKINNPT
jgi:hypothetical protein